MTLSLSIRGVDRLDNGAPAILRLNRHGAIIGRSIHADWSLPDPKNHISSRHCEISYRDGAYVLVDRSTNGTFVNGAAERLMTPHPIADGDRIQVGEFELIASGGTPRGEATESVWDGWGGTPPATLHPPIAEPRAGANVPPPFEGGGWDTPAPLSISAWASDAPEPTPPSATSLWGELARRDAAPTPEPLPNHSADAPAWGPPEAATVSAAAIQRDPANPSGRPAALLRRMVVGLAAMVEARARAKAELGVTATTIELDGNNPLKFIRAPDRALEALLGPPQPGFMGAEAAIDDAFRDLQLHELATVAATRAAMEQTLARFSPAAIRARRRDQGLLARLLPQARAAALWRAYEDEFEGVVRGADEAFMDLFGKAFRAEYARCLDAASTRRR